MKNIYFIFILFIAFSCKKTGSNFEEQIAQEDLIKFTTNLDLEIYNVLDTLPLTISLSSKVPVKGIKYSIVTTWKYSSQQILNLIP